MAEDDISSLSSLELVRRLAFLLPDGSSEQAQLFGVIKGLSTAGFFGQSGKSRRWETGGEARAQKVLQAILPKISLELPGNTLVAELLKRYSAPDGKA